MVICIFLSCAAISGFPVDGTKRARRVFSDAGNGFHARRQVRHRRTIGELRSKLRLRRRQLALNGHHLRYETY